MAGFGKAFDEAFRPANTASITGAMDIIKEKIKLDQTKAEEKLKAVTMKHSNILMASEIPDKILASKALKLSENVGDDLESQKNIQEFIQKQMAPKDPVLTQIRQEAALDRKIAHKDTVYGQALQRVVSARGDTSLTRTEFQRDAAAQGYNTITNAESRGKDKPLSRAEYMDTLAQMWKAKSGVAPTEESMAAIEGKTLEEKLNNWGTFITGKPLSANSPDIIANLKGFLKDTGEQLDRSHDAYMAPHLSRPRGLTDEEFAPIASLARGLSFKDATDLVTVTNKATKEVKRVSRKQAQEMGAM